MALTTLQILSLARAKLLESTPEILSDATLLIYANLTQDDLVKRTFTNDQIKTTSISFVNGVGVLPIDFGTLYSDAYDLNNNYFGEQTIDDFNKGTSERGVTIEGNTIKAYPNTTASLMVKYYPTVNPITAGSTSSLNPYLHECIIYGILFRALEDLQDEEKSKFYRDKYESEIHQKTAVLSNYEESNVDSSSMFKYVRLID